MANDYDAAAANQERLKALRDAAGREARDGPANSYQLGGDHYRKRPIQHWDFVLANGIPYMEAQVMKYLFRWRDKGGLLDLEKARHYLDKLIEHETTATSPAAPDDLADEQRRRVVCEHVWVKDEERGCVRCDRCGVRKVDVPEARCR
jgi:hypothetical protein